jgi:septal ring factor EnvC (AmiA/AmiB activator)
MGNFVRVLIYAAFATGLSFLVAADMCQITDTIAQKKEFIRLANASQAVSLLQAQHVACMEKTLTNYSQEMAQQAKQVQLLEESLETATVQLQGLILDNSKLEAELDSTSAKIAALEDELLRAREALAAKIKELEEAQNHG